MDALHDVKASSLMNGTGTRDVVGAEHSDLVSDIFERVAAGGIEAFAEFYDAVIGRT